MCLRHIIVVPTSAYINSLIKEITMKYKFWTAKYLYALAVLIATALTKQSLGLNQIVDILDSPVR